MSLKDSVSVLPKDKYDELVNGAGDAEHCAEVLSDYVLELEAENAKQEEVIKNISIANERMKAKYVKLIQAGDEIIDLVEADANYQLKVKITKFDKTHRTNKKDLLNKIKADAIMGYNKNMLDIEHSANIKGEQGLRMMASFAAKTSKEYADKVGKGDIK